MPTREPVSPVEPEQTSVAEPRRFSKVQVLEATAAAVLAAAILGTATGMTWLVISLPNELQKMKEQINLIIQNQATFGQQFNELREQVNEHDRRLIKLELK